MATTYNFTYKFHYAPNYANYAKLRGVCKYSPERVSVERERRERPPRRYDKNGEDEAKSEA